MIYKTSVTLKAVLTTLLVLSTSTLATPVPGFEERATAPSAPSVPAAPVAPAAPVVPSKVGVPQTPTAPSSVDVPAAPAAAGTPATPVVAVDNVPVAVVNNTPVNPGTIDSGSGGSDALGCSPGYAGLICGPCQPGTFSAGGSAATCTPCAAGSFSSSTKAAQCTLCPASTYADKTGSTSCTACPTGSVSKIGSSSFAACATAYHVLIIDSNGNQGGYVAANRNGDGGSLGVSSTTGQALTVQLPKTLAATSMPITLSATQAYGSHSSTLAFGATYAGSSNGVLTQGTDDETPDYAASTTDYSICTYNCYYNYYYYYYYYCLYSYYTCTPSTGETDIFVLGAYDSTKNQIPISLQLNDNQNAKDIQIEFYHPGGNTVYIEPSYYGGASSLYLVPV